MFEILAFVAVIAILIIMIIYMANLHKNPQIKLCAVDGDEDVKIAGDYSPKDTAADQSDEAAAEFLRQKQAGNIEIAGHFGRMLAERLWTASQDMIMSEDNVSSKDVHHRILLLSYAVNNFIIESAPSSLLAETAMSEFYNESEKLSDIFYRHINDMSAFSLYILKRRDEDSDNEVGRIYAKLTDKEDDLQKVAEGEKLYNDCYNACKEIYNKEISYNL